MAKNIIKEIIIILLLTLAIILILGVLLYKYVPSNKIIPETISYTTPENVKTEIQTDESIDTSEVVVTYQIDSTDLSNYKKIQEYVPGKKNPFATTTQETTGQNSSSENTSGNTNSATNTGNSSSNTNTTNNTNTGYLPDKGTK